MITAQQFINKTLGKPWVDRATGPDSYDCYGVVIQYFSEVKGIHLPAVKGYKSNKTGLAEGYDKTSSKDSWSRCELKEGAVFMVFSAGVPSHCGIVTQGRLLHCMGSEHQAGQVCHHPLRLIEKIYDCVEFWEYLG